MIKVFRQNLRQGLFLIGFVVGTGCNDGPSLAPPTEEEINILIEALLLESALQDFTPPLKDTLAERYYTELYDRYGVDDQFLNNTRLRFGEDALLWERVTDSVLARLERRRTSPDSMFSGAPLGGLTGQD